MVLRGDCDKKNFEKVVASGFGINAPDGNGETPLHLAIGCRSHRLKKNLTCLLAGGADVNAANKEGNTPLHLLAGYNQFDMSDHESVVNLLLKKGANKNLKNKKGELPLHIAYDREGSTVLGLLEPDNAELSADARGRTSLHLAAGNSDIILKSERKGCLERFRKALAAATNPMIPDEEGNTPLHYAANIGFYEAIEELPATAETINAVNQEGYTAISLAVGALLSDQYSGSLGVTDTQLPGLQEIVRVLSDSKARFAVEDRFAALSYERKRLAINALLEKGADPRIVGKEGENAIERVQNWLQTFGSNSGLRETKLY